MLEEQPPDDRRGDSHNLLRAIAHLGSPEAKQVLADHLEAWVKKNDNYAAVRSELFAAAEREPCETTEYQGMVDFHWGFDQESQADELADALQEIVETPEVVVLRIMSRDDASPSRTLKDERHVRH